MKNIIYPNLIRNLVAASLAIAVFVSSSMVALATPGQPLMGELTVTGAASEEAPSITVNGERGFSGRTIANNTILTTSADAGAVINLGKAGRIELAPNTTVTLNFDEKNISADLTSGQAKVFNAADVKAQIVTKDGAVTGEPNQANVFAVNLDSGAVKTVSENGSLYLNNGESIVKLQQTQDTDDTDDAGATTAVYVGLGIIAAAVAGTLIYVYTRDDEDLRVVSPVR